MTPFFSVIITTHNSQKTIKKTLNSVVSQTIDDFELIIVDDCSSDSTVNLVDNILSNTGIKYKIFKFRENLGVSTARNKGVSISNGDYIAFLDGDDMWLPDKLETQKKIIDRKRVYWTFSNYYVMSDFYKKIGKRYRKPGTYSYNDIVSNGNPIGMLTVVVKRDILLKFPFKKIHHEDYDLWLRISKAGYVGYMISDYLGYYMKGEESVSSNKLKSILWTYRVYRKNGEGFFKSIRFISSYILNVVTRVS